LARIEALGRFSKRMTRPRLTARGDQEPRRIAEWPSGESHVRSKSSHKDPLRYGRPGVLRADPARPNASPMASPVMDPGLLWPGRISAGRRRFSDSAAVSARAVAGRTSKA